MTPHSNTRISAVPQPRNQKVPFLVSSAPFSTKWLGHRGFQDEASFRRLILQFRRGAENVHWLLNFFAYGLRYRCVSVDLSKHDQKNRFVFRGRIWELGENIAPQNCSPSSRLRIWRRLWLCNQTWPNSIRWRSYWFSCHAQIVLSSQNHYHTLMSKYNTQDCRISWSRAL